MQTPNNSSEGLQMFLDLFFMDLISLLVLFKNHSPVLGKQFITEVIQYVSKALNLPNTYRNPFFLSVSLTCSIYFSNVHCVWSNFKKVSKNFWGTFYELYQFLNLFTTDISGYKKEAAYLNIIAPIAFNGQEP